MCMFCFASLSPFLLPLCGLSRIKVYSSVYENMAVFVLSPLSLTIRSHYIVCVQYTNVQEPYTEHCEQTGIAILPHANLLNLYVVICCWPLYVFTLRFRSVFCTKCDIRFMSASVFSQQLRDYDSYISYGRWSSKNRISVATLTIRIAFDTLLISHLNQLMYFNWIEHFWTKRGRNLCILWLCLMQSNRNYSNFECRVLPVVSYILKVILISLLCKLGISCVTQLKCECLNVSFSLHIFIQEVWLSLNICFVNENKSKSVNKSWIEINTV